MDADIQGRKPERTVRLAADADSGVLLAFDIEGLTAAARRVDGLIVLVPQVGDFVIIGEPVFHLFGGATSLKDRDLLTSVALGPERTLTQDPAFALRILVDIANKALSPGINDPTTAVEALDYTHWLLRRVGAASAKGRIRDEVRARPG